MLRWARARACVNLGGGGCAMPLCKMQNADGTTTFESVPECCRCGFCCLSEPCPVGVLAFGLVPEFRSDGIRPRGRCPGLARDASGIAVCRVFENAGGEFSDVWAVLQCSDELERRRAMGFGVGCCLAGRVRDRAGAWHVWASLPDTIKRGLVARITD